MKKIFGVALIIFGLFLITSGALAETPAQQSCVKQAQTKRQTAIKTAQDALASATKDATKARQDAISSAQNIFDQATKIAQKTKQDAVATAQKITDASARASALKAANDRYAADSSVKRAQVTYLAALKMANDTYNNNAKVEEAVLPFKTAVNTADASFQSAQKLCLANSASGLPNKTGGNIFSRLLNFIKSLFGM